MKEKLYIPKKLNIGFQTRTDTYSGKLAYIIYWDDTGKLRKELSWQSWRDSSIDPMVVDNEPLDGFVLNKNVGGTRSGSHSWDTRMEKVRVWDSRGFEFEIGIPNLLFILQECTSTKGKGLEGKFVYAWSGTELILLPVDSAEYRSSVEFTDVQSKKIDKADIVVGNAYLLKDLTRVIYLGRFPYRRFESIYDRKLRSSRREWVTTNKHIFVDEKNNIIPLDGFTKIAKRLSDSCVENYAELVQDYVDGSHHSKLVGLTSHPFLTDGLTVQDLYYARPFVKEGDDFRRVQWFSWAHDPREVGYLKCNLLKFRDGDFVTQSCKWNDKYTAICMSDLHTLDLQELYVVLESGKEVPLSRFSDETGFYF